MKRALSLIMAFGLGLAGLSLSVRAEESQGGLLVVVKSNTPSIAEGSVINGNEPLNLDENAVVTLISEDGSVLNLKGPQEKIPAAVKGAPKKEQGVVKALRALMSKREISTASLGVVRSKNGAVNTNAPDPWYISLDKSGDRCVQNDILVLWRQDAKPSSQIKISNPSSNKVAQLDWAAGDYQLPLSGKKFSDSGKYTVEMEGQRIDMVLHKLPTHLTKPGEQIAWMANAGCETQAMALLENTVAQ